MITRDFSWGKGGWCVQLTTYHLCSAESQEIRGLKLPGTPLGHLGLLRDDLYFTFCLLASLCLLVCPAVRMSVCLSACNNSAPTRRFCMKFNVWTFFKSLEKRSGFIKIWLIICPESMLKSCRFTHWALPPLIWSIIRTYSEWVKPQNSLKLSHDIRSVIFNL